MRLYRRLHTTVRAEVYGTVLVRTGSGTGFESHRCELSHFMHTFDPTRHHACIPRVRNQKSRAAPRARPTQSLRTRVPVGMDELHYAYYEQAREDAEEELRAVDDLIAFYEELCALRLL